MCARFRTCTQSSKGGERMHTVSFCCTLVIWIWPLLRQSPGWQLTGLKTLTLYFSASCTMRSMSSFDNRPLSFVMVILFLVPAWANQQVSISKTLQWIRIRALEDVQLGTAVNRHAVASGKG